MNKFFLYTALLFLMATALLLFATRGEKPDELAGYAGISEEAVPQEQATVGGDFTLMDQTKNERRAQNFHGKLMLVFFGFTHCPDICPVTISTLSSLMELLGDKANQVTPIFITVDPARDTPDVMKDYLSNFDSRIVGLSGTKKQIKQVAEAYKAYYSEAQKPAEENAHANHTGGHEKQDNYLVDHSGYIYLMDREGKYMQHFRYNVSEQELADALKPHLQ